MASYGIGPARIVAAAVEQFADEHGISWPRSLAPFAVHLVTLGREGSEERAAADAIYARSSTGGVEVLYDDRDIGPGEKFADAELLGCPLRITVGRRSLDAGEAEVQIRRGRREAPGIPLAAPQPSSCRPWMSCGGAFRRPRTARRPTDHTAPARPRSLRAAAARDGVRPAAAAVDAPEHHRLRAPGADPGVSRRRALQRRRHGLSGPARSSS